MTDNSLFNEANAAYVNGDFTKAFNLFLRAAKNGDASAMSRVALMYGDGEGIGYDFDKSVYWDMEAINAGSISSLRNLGISYRTHGDIIKAKEWFQKALESGDHDAALELAKLYMVSNKETDKIKTYLYQVINSHDVCESTIEEAKSLLSTIDE